MKTVTFAMVSVIVAACTLQPVRDVNSVFYSISAGSILRLNQTLELPPEQVSVYMQHGKLMAESLLDRYQPYCKFELYSMSETGRRVQPDSFVIRRVVDETEMTTQLPMQPGSYVVASLQAGFMLVSDTPSVYTYTTHLYLHSDIQPDVYRMSCMHWEDVQDDNYLSVAQMREAMGDIFSLQLAEQAADH